MSAETAAAAAADAVGTIAADIEAGAAAAIEAANARAVNAEAAAAAIADGAIRSELSDRINDVAEDVLQCRDENQALRLEIQSLSSRLLALETKPPEAPTIVVTETPQPIAPELAPQSTPPASPQVTVISPSGNVAAVPRVPATKPNRFRLG